MRLCPRSQATATVAYNNSGSFGWLSGRMGQVAYLGTWEPTPGQDGPSPLGGDGTNATPTTAWPRYNRIAVQPAPYVGPGQVSWFQFLVQAPTTPGSYRLYLRPLIEGAQWMEDYGVFWLVTVLNPDGSVPTTPLLLAPPPPVVTPGPPAPTPTPSSSFNPSVATLPPPATTVVSLTFDDNSGTQWSARQTLRDHSMRATFYVNSGLTTDQPGGWRMMWSQLHDLAADGHEITGHTLTHADLTRLTADEQRREACDDRTNLLNRGFAPVASFAYPYGSYAQNGARSAVQQCGYTSARTVGGLRTSLCPTCPVAETIPPLDPFVTRTPPDIRNTTTLAMMQSYVTDAENNGGGWVQLVFHHVCDTCDEYSTTLSQLVAFLDWLQPRAASGTVVKTVAEVMGATAP